MEENHYELGTLSIDRHEGLEGTDTAKTGAATAGLVLGLVACGLNAILITAPLGLLIGIIGIILSAVASSRAGGGRAGILTNVLSLGILAVWGGSLAIILASDPTLL